MALLADPHPRPAGPPATPGRIRTARGAATRARAGVALRAALSLLLAASVIAVLLPRAAGVRWADIGSALAAVAPVHLAALAALWGAGVAVRSLALAPALPGLGHRRAVLLHLSGSAVASLVPLGPAAGFAANYALTRRWGFGQGPFGRWAVVTSVWDVLTRLTLAGLALTWLAIATPGTVAPDGLGLAGATLLAVAAAAAAAVTVLAAGDTPVGWLGRCADVVVRQARRRPPEQGCAERLRRAREETGELVTTAWARLTIGTAGHAALQAALLWLCLAAVGAPAVPAAALAALAAERILSLFPLTPGGVGLVEVGMAALLVACGTDAVTAAAGVLLYRAVTTGLEVQTGGLVLLWSLGRRPGRGRGPAGRAPGPAGGAQASARTLRPPA